MLKKSLFALWVLLSPVLAKLLMKFFGLFPIQKKAIFISWFGQFSNCNPREIYEQMRKQLPDYRYIWLMRDASTKIDGAEVEKYLSIKAIYHLATAALWVNNTRKPAWMVKRKGQYYVQTWHGGLVLKKVEKDVEDKLSKSYLKEAKLDSESADLFLSASKWQSKNYRAAFWYDKEILEYGCPRSDVFYQDGTEFRKRVYKHYNLLENFNLAVYAPTFRNSMDFSNVYLSADECAELVEALEKRFGGKWRLIIRLHPNMADKQSLIQYNDKILNGTEYDEINDLIIASDFLITDYSSCMFDAMEAGKKVVLYATDIDEYLKGERELYFSFDELPFPLAENENELITLVETFDFTDLEKKKTAFLEKIGCFNNADSSKKVAEYIIKQLNFN